MIFFLKLQSHLYGIEIEYKIIKENGDILLQSHLYGIEITLQATT